MMRRAVRTVIHRALARALLCAAICGLAAVTMRPAAAQEGRPASEEIETMMEHVHWLGHAGIKITGETVVYVDPFKIQGGEPADLILITHDHFDHLSPEDIAKVRGEAAVVVAASAKHELPGEVIPIKPGEEQTVAGVHVRAVPAYNPEKRFHPKAQGHVGYVFTVGGVTYYHAGDTDLIPEMESVEADVAFLPVGGTYTMDAAQAAQAVDLIKPRLAVPIHWGEIVGSEEDALAFKESCRCEVRILKPEPGSP